MKAVIVNHPGTPDVLELTEVPIPQLKPNWSRVKIAAFGLNHSEVFTREGKSPSVHFPRILGIEAVGTIDATSDPEKLPIGQKVMSFMGEMGRAYNGSYAEYVLLPNTQIHPVSTGLPWSTLAAIPETGYTAYGALLGLQLNTTDHLLIRGATSGVGVTAAKLASAMFPKIDITGTTRSSDKKHLLNSIGITHVMITNSNVLPDKQKFDKILDLIGPLTVPNSLTRLNDGGIVSSTGELGNQWTLDDFDPLMEIPNNGYLTSFYSGVVDTKVLQQLLTLIATSHVDMKPAKVYSLNDLPTAHAAMEGHENFGKLVVSVVKD